MIYLLPLTLLTSFFALLSFSSPVPFIYNIWFTLSTSIISYLLISHLSSAISIYLIEESLSLLLILLWALSGGGFLLIIILLINSALAPFHLWFINVLSNSESNSLIWGITFHNLPAVGLFISTNFQNLLAPSILSSCVGVLFILSLSSVNSILILSSSNTLASLIIILHLLPLCGGVFFGAYTLLLWITLLFTTPSLSSTLLLFGLIGLPPLLLFQMKWIVIESLWSESSSIALLFSVLAGVSSLIYMRFILLTSTELSLSESISFLFIWIPITLFIPTY